ncbi:antigen 5 like allergen Cul n 1-like [Drosophila madeirensis]|uniref:Venom allergen-1 n=1 Tax=Drosophila madeirensis TaxID=30013 RepID=A0AAU9G0H0_DROMD
MLRPVVALLSIIGVLLALAEAQTPNYCDSALCGSSTHIACNNNGAWASTCPTSPAPSAVTFDLAQRKQILKMHNVRRNRIASGLMAKYKPAKRMATMRWNPELAKLAALNVKQCKMNHDACHNTQTFKASGQNLAMYGYSGPQSGMTIPQLITASVNMWWGEQKDASMTIINKYPSNWSGPPIGHFTAMAQEENTHCGCAAAFYTESGMNNFLMACNYATTNWVGSPVYQRGVKGSGCKTGTNPNYPGLCRVAEVYDV